MCVRERDRSKTRWQCQHKPARLLRGASECERDIEIERERERERERESLCVRVCERERE